MKGGWEGRVTELRVGGVSDRTKGGRGERKGFGGRGE